MFSQGIKALDALFGLSRLRPSQHKIDPVYWAQGVPDGSSGSSTGLIAEK